MNADIFESDDVRVQSLTELFTNMAATTATTEHICRHCRAFYGACSEHILLQFTQVHCVRE